MSPEERAAETIRAMQDAFSVEPTWHPCLRDDLGDAFDDVVPHIAAAIRAAVDAERERCAQVADEATVKELERFKDCKDNPEVGWEERDMRSYAIDTLAELAARIREGK